MLLRLPQLIRRPRCPLLYVGYWLPYVLVYQLINRFPLFEPRILPLSSVDQSIPFFPVLLPLYVAYIPFYWWTAARAETDEIASLFFYLTHFQLLICSLVWVAYPVAMPREIFYPPETFGLADAFWRWFDPPNNCFPSLHAANCLLFIKFNWRRRARWSTSLFSVAIIASTLLVKQHYFADMLAGAVVFVLTLVFLRSVLIVEAVSESRRSLAGWREREEAVGGARLL